MRGGPLGLRGGHPLGITEGPLLAYQEEPLACQGDSWLARESPLAFWGPHWPERVPLGLTEVSHGWRPLGIMACEGPLGLQGTPLACKEPPLALEGAPFGLTDGSSSYFLTCEGAPLAF